VWQWLVIQTTGILGVLVDGIPSVVLGDEFFDFPNVLLGTDGEFEIFLCDRIPVL
jgi:hypothetical protein